MRRKYENMNANALPQSARTRRLDERLGVEELPEQLHEDLGLISGHGVTGAGNLDVPRLRLRVEHGLRDVGGEDVRRRAAHEQRRAGDRAPRGPQIDRIAPPAAADELAQ